MGVDRPGNAVIVTGGASGIGRGCAHAVAEVGRPVAVWDTNEQQATAVAQELLDTFDVRACMARVDVRNASTFDAALATTAKALGPIGGLVHSAGVVSLEDVDRIDDEAWDRVVDVNLRALALLARAVLPELRASAPGSAIVGIASVEAIVGDGRIPAYCASKAGMLGLVRSLAVGLAPEGIRVNTVCPGYVETPMTAAVLRSPDARARLERQVPLRRIATPADVGRVVRFLLSEDAGYVTGTEVVVDGGLTRSLNG